MATIIQQEVFKGTTTKSLYDLYMNAKTHSLIIDGPVVVSEVPGSSFTAFGDYITGKILMLVKDQLIVQSWRGSDWKKDDPDSVFVLALEQKGKDSVLNMIHSNVPEEHMKNLDQGWHDHYWNPWKQHLAGQTIKRPPRK